MTWQVISHFAFQNIEGLGFYIPVYRIFGFYKIIYSLQSFRGQKLIYLGISHAL